MRIIVVGAGKVGSTLARQLVGENHEVTVIDKNQDSLNKIIDSIDCMSVAGNGAVQSVLVDAGIKNADLLIACTNSDEINMLTCLMAHKNSKCIAIARIRDPEYGEEINFLQNEFNISLTINPEQETAHEIQRILRYSSTLLSESFFDDSVSLLKVAIDDKSPLCNMKLSEVTKKMKCSVVLCIIERGDEIIVPKGYDKILTGDKISFVADDENALKFFKHNGMPYKPVKSMMILGGGKIAYYLIKLLRTINKSLNIKVIDNDKSVCNELADAFQDISVIHGDGSDQRMLVQEGINCVDAFLSLTGIDEENIVYSIFAKEMGCPKILTKINRISFTDAFKQFDIGSVINPEIITANLIIKQVRSLKSDLSSNMVNFYSLCNGKVEAIEFYINEESDITNKMFRNMNIKNDVIVACIKRNNKIIIPTGSDMLMQNDNVVIVTKDLKLNNIKDILTN